ncbi:MAG: hypothetical protein WB359_02410 [Bryobacteraceae bacterium]
MSKRRPANGGMPKQRIPAQHAAVDQEPKKRGRKPGKHSDENYTQTSIYLPIELRNRVRARLYENGMEMSGLVEVMLREWLAKQG